MKTTAFSLLAALAVALSAQAADVTTTLSKVHLCCNNCVTGAQKALDKVDGVKAKIDKDAGTIELTGADKATVQKGADALVAAGYFGKSSDAGIKLNADTGAKGVNVQTLKISDLHLCCDKCVKAVDGVVKAVPGAKSQDAVKGAKSFTVTGDFNDKDLMTALQNAGLTGKVGK
jgi:mercuric ion binding protein